MLSCKHKTTSRTCRSARFVVSSSHQKQFDKPPSFVLLILGFVLNATRAAQSPTCLLVVEDANYIVTDRQFVAFLEAAGYTVILASEPSDDTSRATLKAQGEKADLIAVSASTLSWKLGDVFADLNTNFISWEEGMYPYMGMCKDAGVASNFWFKYSPPYINPMDIFHPLLPSQQSLVIREKTCPLAGGLSGEVDVYTIPYGMSVSSVNDLALGANIITTLPRGNMQDPEYAAGFYFKKGDILIDGTPSPGIRVAMFPYHFTEGDWRPGFDCDDPTNGGDVCQPADLSVPLTEHGIHLIEAAIWYATPRTYRQVCDDDSQFYSPSQGKCLPDDQGDQGSNNGDNNGDNNDLLQDNDVPNYH